MDTMYSFRLSKEEFATIQIALRQARKKISDEFDQLLVELIRQHQSQTHYLCSLSPEAYKLCDRKDLADKWKRVE